MSFLKIISITVVCFLLGIMLSLQYKGIDVSEKLMAEEYVRIEDVKNQLLSEINKNQELAARNAELLSKIEEFQSSYGTESEKLKLLEQELKTLKIFIGLNTVKGSGVVITLARGSHEFSSIRDTDLLKLVNELKASGAQAICINNERLTSMSEIREAGNLMIINGRKTSEPYIIKAISDKDKLDASLGMPGGVAEELRLYMDVKIEKNDEVVISGLEDDGLIIKTDLLSPVE